MTRHMVGQIDRLMVRRMVVKTAFIMESLTVRQTAGQTFRIMVVIIVSVTALVMVSVTVAIRVQAMAAAKAWHTTDPTTPILELSATRQGLTFRW